MINNEPEYIDHDVISSIELYRCTFDFHCIFMFVLWNLDSDGDYYRLLADGSYYVQVKKPGYKTQKRLIHVHNQHHQVDAQRVDFVLHQTSSDEQQILRMLNRYMNKVIFDVHQRISSCIICHWPCISSMNEFWSQNIVHSDSHNWKQHKIQSGQQ